MVGYNGTLRCCWPKCRITDLDMLCLDHIHNDGHKEPASWYYVNGRKCHRGGNPVYTAILARNWSIERYRRMYQTLCCNHNTKKQIKARKAMNRNRQLSFYLTDDVAQYSFEDML